jgi:hypothetical protein
MIFFFSIKMNPRFVKKKKTLARVYKIDPDSKKYRLNWMKQNLEICIQNKFY